MFTERWFLNFLMREAFRSDLAYIWPHIHNSAQCKYVACSVDSAVDPPEYNQRQLNDK